MNRKDILGNEIKFECVGCAIVCGEVKLPGGIIYDGESIILAADPEIPIPGFLIVTSKRHIQSFAELTVDERAEIGNTIAIAERAIKDLKIKETAARELPKDIEERVQVYWLSFCVLFKP